MDGEGTLHIAFVVACIYSLILLQLFGLGQPREVVVFICRPLHEHFNPSPGDKDHTHILSGIQTSSWPHPPFGVPLEPPNSLQGEAAAGEEIKCSKVHSH